MQIVWEHTILGFADSPSGFYSDDCGSSKPVPYKITAMQATCEWNPAYHAPPSFIKVRVDYTGYCGDEDTSVLYFLPLKSYSSRIIFYGDTPFDYTMDKKPHIKNLSSLKLTLDPYPFPASLLKHLIIEAKPVMSG